jgi:hypothetical protein
MYIKKPYIYIVVVDGFLIKIKYICVLLLIEVVYGYYVNVDEGVEDDVFVDFV